MGNSETKEDDIVEDIIADEEQLSPDKLSNDQIVDQIKINIEVLPGDAIRLLASKLPYTDIAYLCRTSNNFNRKICDNKDFQISYGAGGPLVRPASYAIKDRCAV